MSATFFAPGVNLCVPTIARSAVPLSHTGQGLHMQDMQGLQMGPAMDDLTRTMQYFYDGTENGVRQVVIGSWLDPTDQNGERRYCLGAHEGPAVILHRGYSHVFDSRFNTIQLALNPEHPDTSELQLTYSVHGVRSKEVRLIEAQERFRMTPPAQMLMNSALLHDRLYAPLRPQDLVIQTITRAKVTAPDFMVVTNKTRVPDNFGKPDMGMRRRGENLPFLSVYMFVAGEWKPIDPSVWHITPSEGPPCMGSSHQLIMTGGLNLVLYMNLTQGSDDFGAVMFAHPIQETGTLFYQDPTRQIVHFLADNHVDVSDLVDVI